MRSRPEVTRGLVERMTPGEAARLLSAKGYLKSRSQAMIGTKIPGRVERMYVQEGMKVKKGDTLAVIEHNDMKALLASREAQLLKNQAELEEARADRWEKEREEGAGHPPPCPAQGHAGGVREGRRRPQEGAGPRGRARGIHQADQGQHPGDPGHDRHDVALRPLRRDRGREAGRGGRGHHAHGHELLDGPDGRRDDRRPRDTWTSRPTSPRACSGRSPWASPPRSSVDAIPSKRYRGRLRQVLPLGDRNRATVKVKVEILDPDDKLFPELAATVHFLPSEAREGPRREPVLALRAQVGPLPGERPRSRLGHRRRGQSAAKAARGGRRRRPTTWHASSRGWSTASRSSSIRCKALRDDEVVRIAQ